MRKWTLLLLTLVVSVFIAFPVAAQNSSTSPKVIAYLAAWTNWSAQSFDASKLTHINLSFARIENGKIANTVIDGKAVGDAHYAELQKMKEKNPNLKVLIAVGGWGGDGFSDAAATPEAREIFAQSAADYIQQYNIDGIDMDWEYPVNGAWGTIKSRPEDKQNFTLLMQALRNKLDLLEAKTGKHYLLSYAANISPWYLDNTEPAKLASIVDYVNLMTYDLHGGWEAQTGHHTPLLNSIYDQSGIGGSMDGVLRYLHSGFTSDKINLGVAFYGRFWPGVDNKNHGLYQKASQQGAGDIKYCDLVAKYNAANGFVRYWDASAQAPYLFNASKGIFVTYDDPQSIKAKADFVKKYELGGIFTWELSSDKDGVLLTSMYSVTK